VTLCFCEGAYSFHSRGAISVQITLQETQEILELGSSQECVRYACFENKRMKITLVAVSAGS
jgi:hypothetical protein